MLSRLSYFANDFILYLVLICLAFLFFSCAIFKLYRSALSKKRRNLYLALVSLVFAIILTYSAAEAYFRFVYDESDGLGFLKTNARWHQRHVVTNNYFVRDRDFETAKAEGVRRIGVIGDSITFGGGIKNQNDRFSNLLEDSLNKEGKNVQVYNLGKPGYDTDGELGEYEKFRHLNFDIIVWQYFLNDIQPLGKSTGTPIINKNSQRAKIIDFLSQKSFFFDFMYWRFSQKYQKTFAQLKDADIAQYNNPEVFGAHKNQIEGFLKELKEEDKKVIVIIFPFIHLLGPNYPAGDIHKELGQIFKDGGADAVIDLLDDLENGDPKKLMASRFDSHPNESVHALAAQRLFEVLNSFSPSPRLPGQLPTGKRSKLLP